MGGGPTHPESRLAASATGSRSWPDAAGDLTTRPPGRHRPRGDVLGALRPRPRPHCAWQRHVRFTHTSHSFTVDIVEDHDHRRQTSEGLDGPDDYLERGAARGRKSGASSPEREQRMAGHLAEHQL